MNGRRSKRDNIPVLGMLRRYDEHALERLLEKIDLSRIPYEIRIESGFVEMGPNRGKMFVSVRMRVQDTRNRRKKIWISKVHDGDHYFPWPRGKEYIPESDVLMRVKLEIGELIMHELNENFTWFDRRVFDPHSRSGKRLLRK